MKVSIIIPVFNVEKYIARCLESILSQTYGNLEIILINDCTLDNSMTIVDTYAKKDSRIKITNLEKNRGLMRVREIGIKISTGDYIMFCDSDDWMPENAVQLLIDKAIETHADFVTGAYERINFKGKSIALQKPKLSYGNDSRSVYKSLLNNELKHSLWGKIYKASILRNHDFIVYDHFTNSEDKLLMYQMVEFVENVQAITDVVYYYYVNEKSLSIDPKRFASSKSIDNVCLVSNYLVNKFCGDAQLFHLLEQNLVNVALSLARSHAVNPEKFVKCIDLPEKKDLLSLKKMYKLFPLRMFFRNYMFIRLYSIICAFK